MSNKTIGSISVGYGEYDRDAAANYDRNYDAVFGKARAKNAKRPAAERAREAADAGKKQSMKVQARTARARAYGDNHLEREIAKDKRMKEGT